MKLFFKSYNFSTENLTHNLWQKLRRPTANYHFAYKWSHVPGGGRIL
jgi:hypothetical protein